MREDARPAGELAGALDEALLEAKLTAPLPRLSDVSRDELIERARASRCRVVGFSAPAGYGKTTLLVQWAATDPRPVAWVSLDRFDDDPASLLTLLASAYGRVSPGHADLIDDMSGLGVSVLGRAAPRLANAFRTSPDAFVLMLDDLHELRSPDCHDVLSVVISGIPPGSQLVAASRSEQPHLPRLRAAGDALEFRASDLAFDAAGAEQIFSQAHLNLTRDAAAAVTVKTEGWPVGLYLAALIASDSSGGVTISGDDRYVADYLYRESLVQLSEDEQRFLRRTAVLDQLSAPLCEAVVGESDGQERLLRLEARSLFLIPLDRRREWYRYHGLFREFLLAELRRVEPDIVTKLHLRAADWYESNGSPALAVEHLLNTTERGRCVQLVTELVLPTFETGQISTIQRWLSTLGDAAIEEYPPLAVLAGWITMYIGPTAAAQRWAAFVDAASFDHVPLDGSASFDSARAMLRAMTCPAGPDQMLADASLAVAQEPPWSPWLDIALCLCAEAHLLTGDVDRATALFMEASTAAATVGNAETLIVSEAELALLAMDRGRWEEAAGHIEVALAGMEEGRMHDYPTCVLALAGAARLAVHRGDLKETNRLLAAAMRARPTMTFVMPTFAVRTRLQLARVNLTIADRTAARHLLREIDDVLLRRPALGALTDEVTEFRRLLSSSAQLGATGESPLTPAELRLLPYLQTHLTIREIAQRQFVSRNTVNSQVSSIYRKLGVTSRNDAVEQATTAGLLGG
jgi:LuxR family transcriptional regulator, maltose regulon positive regulatory protein